MLKLSIWYFFALASLVVIDAKSFSSVQNKDFLDSSHHNVQRSLDSTLYSVRLETDGQMWCYLNLPSQIDETSGDLYLPTLWTIFISSNETVLSNGTCSLFSPFVCSQSDCSEDNSSLYPQNFPIFSSSDATRLILAQPISLGSGVWQINSSIIYLHGCGNLFRPMAVFRRVSGQIGLGLSGKARHHFQDSDPTFSIILNSFSSGELIFGFNSSYVNDASAAISLPCDLDWKMQVDSVSIGGSILSSTPTIMIFDVETLETSLPSACYTKLKNYFFNLMAKNDPAFGNCLDQGKVHSFMCFFYGDLQNLPFIVFTLKNGVQFPFTPAAYTSVLGMGKGYSIQFKSFDATCSGVEYIILGRMTMKNYYTLFQQVNNQTPMITLYPQASTVTQAEFSPLNTSSAGTSSNNNNYEKESDKSLLFMYVVVGTLLMSMLCALGVFVLWMRKRRARAEQEEIVERSRSTLELNERSHFVSSANNNHVDDDNVLSD